MGSNNKVCGVFNHSSDTRLITILPKMHLYPHALLTNAIMAAILDFRNNNLCYIMLFNLLPFCPFKETLA